MCLVVGEMELKRKFFKKANLIEPLVRLDKTAPIHKIGKKDFYVALTKEEVLKELIEHKDDLICSICNLNKAQINEKKATIIPCKECISKKTRLRVYNLSIQKYEDLLKKQNYRCAICNCLLKNVRDNIDHCHRNDHVRGILCGNCNMILGLAHDNVAKLLSACKYLVLNRMKGKWRIQDEKALLLEKFFKEGELVGWKGVTGFVDGNLSRFTRQPWYSNSIDNNLDIGC